MNAFMRQALDAAKEGLLQLHQKNPARPASQYPAILMFPYGAMLPMTSGGWLSLATVKGLTRPKDRAEGVVFMGPLVEARDAVVVIVWHGHETTVWAFDPATGDFHETTHINP